MTDIIKPTVVDGIEFYVANNGDAGMSISGLARMCGVAESTVRTRITRSRENTTETAETVASPYLTVRASQNAKVVSSEFAASVIEHFAFDSSASNEVALFSYCKFAAKGIQQWIHQVTGYSLAGDTQALLAVMRDVLQEVKDLRVETREYKAIRKHNDDNGYDGLKTLLGEMAIPEDATTKLIKGGDADGYFTASEYLVSRGITLDKSHLHKFANLSALTYRTLKQTEPETVMRESTQGTLSSKVKGYQQSDFPLLAIALQKTLAK